jgi:hypothetical protein
MPLSFFKKIQLVVLRYVLITTTSMKKDTFLLKGNRLATSTTSVAKAHITKENDESIFSIILDEIHIRSQRLNKFCID